MHASKTILARNILLMEAAGKVCAAAGKVGVPVLLLKGAALLYRGVFGYHERRMTDIDLLVKSGDAGLFEKLLAGLGYKPMENSSQAWYLMPSASAPPLVIDVHTELWHMKDTGGLWEAAAERGGVEGVLLPGLPDQFLHTASHTLLCHGRLDDRTITDLARLLEYACKAASRGGFWLETAARTDTYGLAPVVYPVLKRLAAARPELVGAGELVLFEPRGPGKIKAMFFEMAARGHSRPLEYLLPVLHRPVLLLDGLFPGAGFLARRYGKNSRFNYFKRPFQLFFSAFRSGN